MRSPRIRNQFFKIDAEIVQGMVAEKQNVTLIDIRLESDFQRFRIPGSIHVPLYAVKSKHYLRSTPLVLVNEGYDYSRPERECRHLAGLGFNARVMVGGLHSWLRKGGEIEGDMLQAGKLNRFPPNIFFLEKDYDDWLIIDVSCETEAPPFFDRSLQIPFCVDPGEFIGDLERAAANIAGPADGPVIICSREGREYGRLERILQGSRFGTAFFLEGGIEGYKRFLEVKAAIKKPEGISAELRKSCDTRP